MQLIAIKYFNCLIALNNHNLFMAYDQEFLLRIFFKIFFHIEKYIAKVTIYFMQPKCQYNEADL